MVRRKLYDWTIVLETVALRVVYVLSSTHVMHMRRGLLCYLGKKLEKTILSRSFSILASKSLSSHWRHCFHIYAVARLVSKLDDVNKSYAVCRLMTTPLGIFPLFRGAQLMPEAHLGYTYLTYILIHCLCTGWEHSIAHGLSGRSLWSGRVLSGESPLWHQWVSMYMYVHNYIMPRSACSNAKMVIMI